MMIFFIHMFFFYIDLNNFQREKWHLFIELLFM